MIGDLIGRGLGGLFYPPNPRLIDLLGLFGLSSKPNSLSLRRRTVAHASPRLGEIAAQAGVCRRQMQELGVCPDRP